LKVLKISEGGNVPNAPLVARLV